MLTRALLAAGGLCLFLAGVGAGFAVFEGDGSTSPDDEHHEERGLVVTVVDGDTVILDTGEPVRLLGIDTPELTSQDCFSTEATERARELLEGKVVTLVRENENEDQFGRLLRWLFLDDGTFVNAQLVWEGYAQTLFFGESRFRQVLVQVQLAASENGKGGWSACD